jgi:hypothetical protein
MKSVFVEKQKFTQWWLWLLLLGLGLIPAIGVYQQLILGEPFGSKPMPDIGMVIFALFMFGFIAMFYFITLKTEIDQNEIRIHFFPFFKKQIRWQDIKNAEVIKYGFVGGWGIRLGTKYGPVYNIKGKIGLALELKTGKKLLIGTQKEDELKDFLSGL